MIARLPPVAVVTLGLVLGILPAAAHAVACTDDAALVAAHAAVEDECPCAETADRRLYAKCVVGVAKARVDAGLLPKACAASIKRCAKNSSCGRPGMAPCCTTTPSGRTTCKVTTPERCTALGGCTGAVGSCCDACGPAGCTSTTTTTIPTPRCGNGRIDSGEQCDGEFFCHPQYCFIPFKRCCEVPHDTGICSLDQEPDFIPCSVFGRAAVTKYGRSSTGTSNCAGGLFEFSEHTFDGACSATVTTFPSVPLCCDILGFGLDCTETTASDTAALAQFQNGCSHTSMATRGFWVSVGTCGPDNHCIPAH